MIDENAFGLLIAYHAIEDDEYALDREHFVVRFRRFTQLVREHLRGHSPGVAARALDLGHAVYVELGEGDQDGSLMGWLKTLRAALEELGVPTTAVLTHGSRWVREGEAPAVMTEQAGEVALTHLSTPSEPLRRALYAEAACHDDEDSGVQGWGPGLYLDTEAAEALQLRPKNDPTVLSASGASFYRVGR